ncbi:MAG: hypothetical protein LBV34_13215 [Nocardiopsaceae bacterium]|jgi:hypothetical protein|nr:hypothetical protein [Nocardiopsaceae bacterium]
MGWPGPGQGYEPQGWIPPDGGSQWGAILAVAIIVGILVIIGVAVLLAIAR